MNAQDNAIQVQLADIFAAINEIIPVYDPSHSDLVDNNNMHAATKPQQNIRKVDTTTSEAIAMDLETLKGHSQEVGNLLDQIMQFAEADVHKEEGGGNNKKRTPFDEPNSTNSVLSAICNNTKIDRPLFKLSMFIEIIRARGTPIEKLSQRMTDPKKDNKFWQLLPSLINTSVDMIIKLFCTWIHFGSFIDLQKIANNSEESNCLLDPSDPCVLNTIQYINKIIMRRRNSSLITFLPGETTLDKKINDKSLMIENLSETVMPCLYEIERTL